MANTPQPGIIIQMMEASQTCRELMGIMSEENANLANQQTSQIEARLQLKKRLALRLEKLLADIKAQKDQWKDSPLAKNAATRLAEEIALFTELAKKNETLLRAAHQLRADIVAVIRDTIDASQPRATTYNADGQVKKGDGGTTVVATTI